MKTTAERKAEREAERRDLANGPPGFREFLGRRPCDACGRRGRIHQHHEGKPRDWRRSMSMCEDCHVWGAKSRHGLGSGAESFWESRGKDPEEIIQRVQREWRDHELPY